ncbi:MAG TPA: DUF4097 family beta strand repeat-containing protein [Patescibacteria group bacterium]|nr:DUF4097 family beta strand repeat-containing protein [Patescibacteria group bacterium]
MIKRTILLVLVLLFLSSPAALSAYVLKDTWHRSFDVVEGVEFILRNVNGGIEIEGWERNEIDVSAEIKIKAPSKSKARELLEKLTFEVEAGSDRVRIDTERPRIRQVGLLGSIFGDKTTITIGYTVKVPPRTILDIKNTNGGISVDAVEGRFDFRTVNGSITITSFSGEGEASTVNGAIECFIDAFPAGGDLELKTVNGGIELALPEGAGGTLDARTANGRIGLDLDLRETVRIKRSSIKGVIGDGTGTIYLKTVNGGISIVPR